VPVTTGQGLESLPGFPFEVRYSIGSIERARASAAVAADAYAYLSRLLSGVEPDIALIIADEGDWKSRQPYGLPYFNDDDDQVRPGIVVMPAGRGEFWIEMGEDLRDASSNRYADLLATYPDGDGGLDLQPFFDLVTIHELGHAFEVLGGLQMPFFWLGEVFANLALHAFIATNQPGSRRTLEVLSIVGTSCPSLDARIRAEGYSSLEDLEAHYTGGDDPMSAANYVWYQYRWQRMAAAMFEADGEEGVIRFWECFHRADKVATMTTAALATLLESHVSETLAQAVRDWR
jgi:hypothetical protein